MFRINPAKPSVFTLQKSDFAFLDDTAFKLVDKFIIIPFIDNVDSFKVVGNGTTLTGEIKRVKKDTGNNSSSSSTSSSSSSGSSADQYDTTYFLNGVQVDEKPFKTFYQALIGLRADAENPNPKPLGTPDVTIAFTMNKGPQTTIETQLEKVNRDFYAAYLNGITEFLVSDYQVANIFSAADKLLKNPHASS